MEIIFLHKMRSVYLNAAVACAVWILFISASMSWNVYYEKQQMYELARNSARDHFNKDQAFRFWCTSHGGVYVRVDERTPPNPYLSHIAERDITTPSGTELTLMNPAYMLRQMMADFYDAMGVKGHITSLTPLNPGNAPDDWEIKALAAFEKGVEEISEITEINGKPFIRLMRPMVTQHGCLTCHEAQGYTVGDIRGGVGVSLPLSRFAEYSTEVIKGLVVSHLFIGFIGVLAIGFMTLMARYRIRERKKSEEELRIKERAIETSVSAIAFADMNWGLNYVNDAFLSMWGYQSKGEVIGKQATEFWVVKKNARRVIGSLLRTGGWWGNIEAVRKDGGSFIAKVSASLIKDDHDKPLCMMASFLDVSKEQKMESQLRQSQKLEAIGSLAGGIAHDFNNILYAILGFAELVQDNLPADSLEWKNQQEVIKAGNRAKDLVRQILTFSRKTERESNPVAINLTIKEVLTLLRSTIPSTIEIRSQLCPEELIVLGDATEIHQVIMNLCTNAFHSMRETGGLLEVTLSLVGVSPDDTDLKELALKPGPYVRFTVRDSGTGIDKRMITKIFDPYFTTKSEGDGTGLGLSVVHGIIKKYDGDIFAASVPDEGATFTVYLPAMVR